MKHLGLLVLLMFAALAIVNSLPATWLKATFCIALAAAAARWSRNLA